MKDLKGEKIPPAVILGMTATGLSIARSLGRKGIEVFGFDSDRYQPGMFSRYVKAGIAPNSIKREEEFIDYLIDFGKKLPQAAILFCASDEYLASVSRHRERLQPYFKFNTPSKETVEDFLDKRRSYNIARSNGLLCPSTYFVENIEELEKISSQIRFPCALKPAISHLWRLKFGGKKLISVNSYDELLANFVEIRKVYPDVMIQELIAGGDDRIYAFYVYFNSKSEPLAIFIKRKLRQHPIHFGIASFSISEMNESVKAIALEFLTKIKYTGVGALELKRDVRDNSFKFTELNMRFLMSGEISIASGVDFPYIMYRDLIGEKVEEVFSFKEGVKLVNLELDLGSFWQYRRLKEITFWQYLRSFKGGRLIHTYLAWDDLRPALFVAFRFGKVLTKKFFYYLWSAFSLPKRRLLSYMGKKKLYKGLPIPVKDAIKWGYSIVPLCFRIPKRFFTQLEFLEQSQWWSRQELENYQNEKLRALIHHAYEKVPYYNRLFKEHRLHPSDIRTIRDLPKIPVLSKDTVHGNMDLFITKDYKKENLARITTSGTTGKVLEIYFDPRTEYIYGGPFEWRFFRWAGYDLDDYCAVFRASFLKYCFLGKEHLFRHNPLQRKVFFSIYDIKNKNIEHYVKGLSQYPISVIHGYPAVLKKLVDMLDQKSIRPPCKPKTIITLAEMLLLEQRSAIEKYFGCHVFDWYGMEERAVIACECERHKGHHLNPEFGICEFEQCENKDGAYEIIATGLTNPVMPFIRYKTGDYVMPISQRCECGREFPLIKILGGRDRCFITDSNGNLCYIIGFLDKFSEFISQFQYVVKGKGKIDIRIVTKTVYDSAREKILLNDLYKKFGENFQINIVPVKAITETKGGKTPLVIYE